MQITPLRDLIIVTPIEEKHLIHRIKDRSKTHRGRVIAVGAGKRNKKGKIIPNDVQVGDIIVHGKNMVNRFHVEHEEILFINNGNILGVIESFGGEQTIEQRESFFMQGCTDGQSGTGTKENSI